MALIYYKKSYSVVPQSWIINCLKRYKVSDEAINFIETTMRTWKVQLTAGGKALAEVKIHRGIFQADALSPLLFVIAMTALINYSGNAEADYKLHKSQENIYHLMYIDDIKLFAKNEKELVILIHAVRICREDMKMEFGIEKCAMLIMKSGKRQMTEGI